MPPRPASGFRWVAAPWGVQLVADGLADFRHGWTTRQLALRGAGEAAGWQKLAEAVGVEPDGLARARQVHGTAVFHAGATRSTDTLPEADIVLTDTPRLASVVQVADCVPMIVADLRTGRVAAAHAGWRGTAAGVAGAAVAALLAPGQSGRELIVAAIGPSIGPCCYRVGAELVSAFADRGWSSADRDAWFLTRGDGLVLDLWQANLDQLAGAGVSPSHAHVSRLCTSCHADWFDSYRRDGPGAGRMAGYVRTNRVSPPPLDNRQQPVLRSCR
jgi:polyphenol oxidase